MRKTKLFIPLVSVVSLSTLAMPMMTLASCGQQGNQELEIEGDINIYVGQTKQLKAKFKDQPVGTFTDNVEWAVDISSGGNAIIKQNGEITATASGDITVLVFSKDNKEIFGKKKIHVISVGKHVIPQEYLDIVVETIAGKTETILRGFNVEKNNLLAFDTLVIPSNVTIIDDYAFYDKDYAESKIPDNITMLKFANRYVDNHRTPENLLSSLTKTIGKYAFCKSPFFRVVLPIGIQTIAEGAFKFSKLEYCNFPEFLQEIGDEAFYNTNIRSVAFNWCYENFQEQKGYTIMPWQHCTLYGAVSEKSQVKSIGKMAFANCKNLVYHKPTYSPSAYGSSYPGDSLHIFEMYDEKRQKYTFSNLKVLDYSSFNFDKSLQMVTYADVKFGCRDIVVDPDNGLFIIINNEGDKTDQPEQQMYVYNEIAKSYNAATVSSLPDIPKKMEYACLGSSETFNFTIHGGHEGLPPDPSSYMNPINVNYSLNDSFWQLGNEGCFSMYEFEDGSDLLPRDIIGFVDNVYCDDIGFDCSKLDFDVWTETGHLNRQILCVRINGLEQYAHPEQITFDLTLISPSLGVQYTFGNHYYLNDYIMSNDEPLPIALWNGFDCAIYD